MPDAFHQSLALQEWLEETAERTYEVCRYEIRDPETDTLFTSGVCRSDGEEILLGRHVHNIRCGHVDTGTAEQPTGVQGVYRSYSYRSYRSYTVQLPRRVFRFSYLYCRT